MAGIISVGINKSKIEFNESGWANVTITLDNETNVYGQNVKVTMSQSKEEREAKEAKTYIGNGKVVWTDGVITKADKVEEGVVASEQSQAGRQTPDLPF